MAVEENNDNISIVGIKQYADYSGTRVGILTEDDLRIVTSTMQTQLLKSNSENDLETYINAFTDENIKVNSYDSMQNTNIDFSEDVVNKDVLNFNHTFNKALILSNDTATIVPLDTWRSYKDDKIQLRLTDGTCILLNADKVKLINDDIAEENALENYAISLVGNKDKVIYYGENNTKIMRR